MQHRELVMSWTPARSQASNAEHYLQRAARVREKAQVASDNALREQLYDLARHYNHLAEVAAALPSPMPERCVVN